ncbi:DUF6308 family protein [Streptomyces sp. NPDC005227]|uniref:DUF6308 family protein n=1 Tax=Streptomyces sp. NPDC005227 TaxID=3364707 RepID=UPI0036A72C6A
MIAGKFLARKRPQLLRVCERVVRCAVGRPPSFWLALYTALQEDGAVLHRRLLGLREVAGVPETVSALRELRRGGVDGAPGAGARLSSLTSAAEGAPLVFWPEAASRRRAAALSACSEGEARWSSCARSRLSASWAWMSSCIIASPASSVRRGSLLGTPSSTVRRRSPADGDQGGPVRTWRTWCACSRRTSRHGRARSRLPARSSCRCPRAVPGCGFSSVARQHW